MAAEQELANLKSALRLWANSRTYQEGCKRWTEIVRLMGEDVSQETQPQRGQHEHHPHHDSRD